MGENVVKYSDVFEDTVKMYVYEEMVNGRKLTEIINQDHENVKYLPGHQLPKSIVSFSHNFGLGIYCFDSHQLSRAKA